MKEEMPEMDEETIDGLYKEFMPQDHDSRVDASEAEVNKLIGNTSPELVKALNIYKMAVERHGFGVGMLFGIHMAVDTIRLYHSKGQGSIN